MNACVNEIQFHHLQNERSLDIVRLLKACAKQRDLEKGSKLHEHIRGHAFLIGNCYICSSLVNMYARCGALDKAHQVFNELPVRDEVTWTALMAGYAQQGKGKEALKFFDRMEREGCRPNAVSFICALKACGNIRAAAKGEKIHEKIVSLGLLEKNIVLGNTLLDMYARCGALEKAHQVLNELPARDVVTWTSLIAGYAEQGQGEEALNCFDDMQHEGHAPNVVTFICALKACGSIRAVAKCEKIHHDIVASGMLQKDILLGSTLIDVYARCGALAKAQQVLNELPVRDVVTWNALIAGYIQQGQDNEALKCYANMQREGHSPNAVTFTYALKACGGIGSIANGKEIHEKIVSLGMLEKDIALGNSLINMYVRCGVLAKAQQVLNELPVRNVITWTTLIAGYTQQGQGEEALTCFDSMQQEGHTPDAATFLCALKACGSIGAVAKGEQVHDKIARLGMLKKDLVLGNSLIDMYVKCAALGKAQKVLNELPFRNVVTWTTLIVGYAEQCQNEEVLKCFDSMQREGHSPNVVTFSCVMKACGSIGAATRGEEIHGQIVFLGMFGRHTMLDNILVDMYVRCGALGKAQEVLDELPVRDMVTWTALIAGYTQQGKGGEALNCFDSMQCEGHSPNVMTFTCALKACGEMGLAAKGEAIHFKLVSLGIVEKDIVLGSILVEMYASCGVLIRAQHVFEELPIRDVVMWNVLIDAYICQGQDEGALKCYSSMRCEGHFPDVVTFICALKACGNIIAVAEGEKIHDELVNLGIFENDIILGNSLVDMYAKCGALAEAQRVLDELPIRCVATWTALIAGYTQQGLGKEALKCFDTMQDEGHAPDMISFVCALKACASIGAAAKGEQLHYQIVSLGMLEKDAVLGNTLVDMYARCGSLCKAQQVLMALPFRDIITWNALIAGHVQKDQGREALECFDTMISEGHSPDAVTYICVLKACRIVGEATRAKEFHDKVLGLGVLKNDILLGNTLLNMYMKFAVVPKVSEVLDGLSIQDAVTWNILIGGYAQQGQSEKAVQCFEKMQFKGVKIDSVTLVGMLYACSHSGLLSPAEMYFSRMSTMYGIIPDEKHCCCMVDLFGRAGKFNSALVMIEKMLSDDYVTIWLALLSVCCKWGNVEIGRLAFERAILIDPKCAAAYTCMANIYTNSLHMRGQRKD